MVKSTQNFRVKSQKDSPYCCLIVIVPHSAYRIINKDEKYFPQIYLGKCKCKE